MAATTGDLEEEEDCINYFKECFHLPSMDQYIFDIFISIRDNNINRCQNYESNGDQYWQPCVVV